MDLKFRISLSFSIVLSVLLAVFSFSVYRQLKKKLVAASGQALTATVEHEWRHMQLGHGAIPNAGETLHTKDAYLRVWKDDVLVRDTFPAGMKHLTDETLRADDTKLTQRFARELDGSHYVLLGVLDMQSTDLYLSALRKVLILGCLLAALLILPFSWFLTRSLLFPFRALSTKAMELNAEGLSFRFEEPVQQDEYGILVRSINALLTRLDKSFKQTRRFATNASHELRTPLTVIRGEAELMLRRERSATDYQTALRHILSHAETLQGIVNRLLFLNDLERMEQEGAKVTIDVAKTVSETLRCLRIAHSEVAKEIEIKGAELKFVGDQEIFGSVVSNVLENALKYSRSQVRVQFEQSQAGVELKVEDDGPGIPEHKRELVFEPFFKRPDSRNAQGHGIGLSIVKACLNVARGKISLENSPLGGLSVKIFFPVSVV